VVLVAAGSSEEGLVAEELVTAGLSTDERFVVAEAVTECLCAVVLAFGLDFPEAGLLILEAILDVAETTLRAPRCWKCRDVAVCCCGGRRVGRAPFIHVRRLHGHMVASLTSHVSHSSA
jgi:hypothetical protein